MFLTDTQIKQLTGRERPHAQRRVLDDLSIAYTPDGDGMNVLIACECSGVVRDAFVRAGHNAYSCDLKEGQGVYVNRHFRADCLDVVYAGAVGSNGVQQRPGFWHNGNCYFHTYWDLLIAHPTCQYLANSGVHLLHKEASRWTQLTEATAFFRQLWEAPIPRVAVENPVMHKYAKFLIGCGQQSQTIQPYQFGHDASKRTCLWLRNLPNLVADPADFVPATHVSNKKGKFVYANQTPSGQNKLGPSKERTAKRSETYKGVADAFAEQWGRAV